MTDIIAVLLTAICFHRTFNSKDDLNKKRRVCVDVCVVSIKIK